VANGAGLAGGAAAVNIDQDVELVVGLGQHQGLPNDHLQHPIREVLVEGPTVDGDVALAGPQIDAGHGRLPSTGTVVLNLSHGSPSL